ncbi:oxidoreductase [Kordiimonas sediminis]|uniref:Oxidoreductase n=1 Tax=Kordiimonas sediminis TaxID=1735581 RepID=A0A919E947_9PROT|nr:aldo/keto reductase [Kordiimonas sediminis]GHF26411.1 oxidoreductase [Kordiimonas sediminis]
MEKRQLGNTDLQVSKICLGTMNMGTMNTEEEGHRQLDMALDYGVNFLDTAELYPVPGTIERHGKTEEIIGNWIKKTGRRDEYIIATKVSSLAETMPKYRPHIGDGNNRLNRAHIREAVEGSLKRLGIDCIDLYQLHWPERATNFFATRYYRHRENDTATPLAETLLALGELIREGKIKHIGLSNETPWGLMECLRQAEQNGLPRVQSVQNPYSLLNRSYEVGMAEISIREKAGLLAYSPLAMGVLSGKYLGGKEPEGARLTLYKYFSRYKTGNAEIQTQRYMDLAQELGMSLATLALAFVNDRPFVTSNIIGATKPEQLQECLESANVSLPNDVLKRLDEIEELSPMPCP